MTATGSAMPREPIREPIRESLPEPVREPVRELLARWTRQLASAGVPAPRHDATALTAHVLGVPRLQVPLLDSLEPGMTRQVEALVELRAQRVPLQHLTGSAGFRGLQIAVGPGVFVPRPETEVLAGWAVQELLALRASGVDAPVAVDLCTGSAAIALALAAEVPSAHVHAVELDETAYGYALRNTRGSAVAVHHGDVTTALPWLAGRADLVVANPPYVPSGQQLEPEVAWHDPGVAVWGGADGLEVVRLVVAAAARLLRPGGRLGVEHAEAHASTAPGLLRSDGRWAEVRGWPDLTGRPRFVTARRAAQ